jgi:hypothetical protein
MKKAEIIKNGNVNLKTVKLDKKVNKEIDWDKLEAKYYDWVAEHIEEWNHHPNGFKTFHWFKKRLSK